MELSKREKDRIKAEEAARIEAHRELHGGWGGCCGGHGWRGWGFWKGVIVGLLAAWLVGGMCRWHKPWGCHGSGMWGHGCYGMGAPMTPPPPGLEHSPKK